MSTTSLLATAASNSLIRTGDGTPVQAASGLVDATGVAAIFLNASGQFVSESNSAVTSLSLGTPQALVAAGAVNLTAQATTIASGGAIALTLADGTNGQMKSITMITDGGDATLTPATMRGGTTIVFNDVGDSVLLQF